MTNSPSSLQYILYIDLVVLLKAVDSRGRWIAFTRKSKVLLFIVKSVMTSQSHDPANITRRRVNCATQHPTDGQGSNGWISAAFQALLPSSARPDPSWTLDQKSLTTTLRHLPYSSIVTGLSKRTSPVRPRIRPACPNFVSSASVSPNHRCQDVREDKVVKNRQNRTHACEFRRHMK